MGVEDSRAMTQGSSGAAGPRVARNLADLVRAAAQRSPDKAALVSAAATMTWAELDRAVDELAAGLSRAGHTHGARVGLALGNTLEFAVAYFATLRADAVAVPLNPQNTVDELVHQLADSGARLVVCSAAAAPAACEAAARLDRPPTVATAGPEESPSGAIPLDRLRDAAAGPVRPHRGAEDLAVLLYTSGTTGRPRAAMLSHRALLANLEQLARLEHAVAGPDDVVLLVLPLFHVYGLNGALGTVVREGATGVLVDRFDPVDTLATIRERGVTNIVGAPPMYVAWSMLADLGDAFRSVRVAVSGSAPLPPAVLEAFERATGHPVYEGYGLTEAAPVVTTTRVSGTPKPGSIGRAIPGVELRLVADDGGPPEDGDPGEIVIRGANLFSGYWPDGQGGPDADGWFRTGDVAYADADGDLFIVDRLRDLIIVSGFNVYPREVEDVLAAHPAVAEVAVVGVPHPYTGESVKALVVVNEGARVTPEELIDHAAASLARFKCPTVVELVDELPHSGPGKIAKGRLPR